MQYDVTPEIRQNSVRSKKICDVAFSEIYCEAKGDNSKIEGIHEVRRG